MACNTNWQNNEYKEMNNGNITTKTVVLGSHEMADSITHINNLFEACDMDNSGFIDKAELHTLCADVDLTKEEFDEVFRELDKDGDGKINIKDFTIGFESVNSLFLRGMKNSGDDVYREDEGREGFVRTKRRGSYEGLSSMAAWERFLNDLELGYYLLCPTR